MQIRSKFSGLSRNINIQSQFKWGDLSEEVFIQRINIAYEEIVKWRRNIFLLPFGKAGRR